MPNVLPGLLILLPSFLAQGEPKPEDRFATEPIRPKAQAPIPFTRSWDRARDEAQRTDRRILAVFSGENCGWCRVLEKWTFTDAEVVELSRQYVCVELDTGEPENAQLADQYGIDSIPRSLVLMADGRVASKRTGYLPPAEYATWLRDASTRSPWPTKEEGPAAVAPPPVGDPEAVADVLFWSVDSGTSVERWGDEDWAGHAQLLRLLRTAGLRPRVEHMSREDFPARWDRAEAAGRAPEVIIADRLAGLVLDLQRKGRLLPLASERLAWAPENASCPDLAGRMAFLVGGKRHGEAGRKAVAELLRPGPEMTLPGPALAESQGRAEAASVACRAVSAFMSGDQETLRSVASASSPQLVRCVRPEAFRRALEVVTPSVEVRGEGAVAFARVEMQFRGADRVGADSALVVLIRESSRWRAYAVSIDILSLKELPALCRLGLLAGAGGEAPSTPQLLFPDDGGRIGPGGRSFAWEVPGEGGQLAAQVCQVLLDGQEEGGWPETRLKAYPGTPQGAVLSVAETDRDLTGVTAERMSWCVWAIGRGGHISASTVSGYRGPEFKY